MARNPVVTNKRMTYTKSQGTRSTSGDGTAIIAAVGAGLVMQLKDLIFWLDDTADTVTVVVKFGDFTFPGVLLNSSRSSFALSEVAGAEWESSANASLILNLSGAVDVNWVTRHRVESA